MTVDKQGSLTQLAQASFDPISQGSKVLLVDSTGAPYVAASTNPIVGFGPDAIANRVAAQVGNSSGPNSVSNPVFTGFVIAGAVYDARVIRALTASDIVSSVQSGAWAVSISASVLPSGASTSANQTTSQNSLASIDGKLTTVNVRTISSATDSIAVSAVGSITNPVVIRADTPLNQVNALKVDASATTQPISATALPLPSGASTSAIQSTQQTSLTSIDGKLSTVNTRLSTASDVVSAVQSGNWNISNITGAVTLPTGASTASAQASAQTSLSSIDSKLTTVAIRALTAYWI